MTVGLRTDELYLTPLAEMTDALMRGTPPGSIGVVSDNRWTDCSLFVKWSHHFISFANCSQDSPSILIIDDYLPTLSATHLQLRRSRYALHHVCSHIVECQDIRTTRFSMFLLKTLCSLLTNELYVDAVLQSKSGPGALLLILWRAVIASSITGLVIIPKLP